jgi:outer membrane lipoprotein-sorting protein
VSVKIHLIFVSIAALHAQIPDAASILETSRHALDRYQSYQFQSTTTVVTPPPPGFKNEPVRMISSVTGMNPGKVHIESETRAFDRPAGVATVVSDGQTTWIYEAERNAYKKQAEGGSIDLLLDFAGAWSGSLPEDAGASPGTVREESIEVDGEKHDCWAVEKTASKIIRPFSWFFQYGLDNFIWTTWIDKLSGFGWRTTVIGKNGPVLNVAVTVAKTALKVNPSLPDSLFIFTPPPGFP